MYLTPFRVAQFYPSQSSMCWHNCGQVGNLYHILWSCKSLTSFWNQIFSLISSIIGILTSPNPTLALLNLDIVNFPPPFRLVIAHILLASRMVIIRHWKEKQISQPVWGDCISQPYLGVWKKGFIKCVSAKFEKIWQPWSSWINA